MSELCTGYYRSPIGWLKITGSREGISSVSFVEGAFASGEAGEKVLAECISELEEYFDGKRREFSVGLDLRGTEFQKKVWRYLQKIPFGQTASYLQIAIAVGSREAVRAVGGANGHNPISVIIPCHRVIGSDGSLTGYGGGLWRKRWLLDFEGSARQKALFSPSLELNASR